MGMPAQVARQAEEADAMINTAATAVDEPPPDDTPSAPPAEPVTQEPKPKARREDDDVSTWRQKYYGLQGVFTAQKNQLDSLKQQVQELREKLVKQPEPEPAQRRVTDKDVESFGSDLIDVIRRQAQDEIDQTVGTHLKEIANLRQQLDEARQQLGQVSQTQAVTLEERFLSGLDAAVPNWRKLQQTEEAQEWLGTEVPGTDFTWDDALKDAYRKGNANKAAQIFQQFLQAHPQLDQARQTSAKARTAQEIQRQVAPARSSAAPAPAPTGQKRMFTSAEFDAEMLKVIRLSKQGKFEDATRLETELNQAAAEGRVRP